MGNGNMAYIQYTCIVLISLFISSKGCPDGWIQYRSKCYYFSSFPDTFPKAGIFCLSVGSKLAEPVDDAEVSFLQNKVKSLGQAYVIGVVDYFVENEWMYVSTMSTVLMAKWHPGEPDSRHGMQEDCVEVSSDGGWADVPCGSTKRFICEKSAAMHGVDILG